MTKVVRCEVASMSHKLRIEIETFPHAGPVLKRD